MAAAKAPELVKAANSLPESDGDRPGETVPGLGASAYARELDGMRNRSFTLTERYGDQQRRADRVGADPRILEFERKLIGRAFKLGVPLFAHCCVRGSAEQSRLFKEGRSKARPGESPHNYGAAVDIVHSLKAWDLTRKQWEIIGHLGKETAKAIGVRVSWGGDWQFYDPAHWELADWLKIRAQYSDGEDWDGR